MDDPARHLQQSLERRFGDAPAVDPTLPGLDRIAVMAAHRSHRAFAERTVAPELIQLLCAVALSAPSKSDLQQRDIVVIGDPEQRRRLHDVVSGDGWERAAPAMLMVCGNNRR